MISRLENSFRCSLSYQMEVYSITTTLSITASLNYSQARLSTRYSSMEITTSKMKIVYPKCTAPNNPKTTQFSATSAKTALSHNHYLQMVSNSSTRRTSSTITTSKTLSLKSLKNRKLVPQPKNTTRKASCKTMDPTSNA